MAEDFVNQFAAKLIKDAGFANLKPEFLSAYQDQLENQIVKRMGIIALENLSEEGRNKYDQLLADTKGDLAKLDKEKVYQLWQQDIKNFSEVMAKGLQQFEQEFLSAIKKQWK